jgi:hypothetical protein
VFRHFFKKFYFVLSRHVSTLAPDVNTPAVVGLRGEDKHHTTHPQRDLQ